jgi:hypothetical protein
MDKAKLLDLIATDAEVRAVLATAVLGDPPRVTVLLDGEKVAEAVIQGVSGARITRRANARASS